MKTDTKNSAECLEHRRQVAIDTLFPDNGNFRLIPANYLTMDIDQLERLAEQKEVRK